MQIPRAVAVALSTIVLLIIGLSVYAVQQDRQITLVTPAPTVALPTATQETPTPIGYATAEILANATQFIGRRAGYSLLLPAGWAIVDPAEYSRYLERIKRTVTVPDLQDKFDLLAYDAQNGENSTSMAIAVVERNGLGLNGYMTAIIEVLRPIGDIEAQIDHTLRADGLPAGIISYTTPGEQVGRNQERIFTQQVVFIDNSGDNFIIITFAGAAEQVDQTQWRAMLQSMTFE
ncbi:MAG: hypothetical protein R2911_31760 [Caldilineaceae bacterium]